MVKKRLYFGTKKVKYVLKLTNASDNARYYYHDLFITDAFRITRNVAQLKLS